MQLLRDLLLDLLNRVGRVEVFRARIRAVHDRVASVELEGVDVVGALERISADIDVADSVSTAAGDVMRIFLLQFASYNVATVCENVNCGQANAHCVTHPMT